MAAWMAYTVVIGGLLMVAAWAAGRGLKLYRRPARFAWAAALLAAVVIPAAALVMPAVLPSVAPAGAGIEGAGAAVALVLEGLEASGTAAGVDVDALLVAGWLLASLVLVVRVVSSRVKLAAELAPAERRRMGEIRLYLTSGLGPAVTGLRHGRVVLPRWLWRLSPRERRLAVAHEREHLRAGDPWLLAGARLLVLLLPWYLPLWWGLRRLRLTVETDCDRRVLRAGADPRDYGALLLRVGERSSRIPGLAALAERTSLLERRIDEMTRPVAKYRGPKALVTGALALAAVVGACESPTPGEEAATVTGEEAAPSVQAEAPAASPPYDADPELTNVEEVREALQAAYPADLREQGVGGAATLWLQVDTDGRVAETRVTESSGREELDAAAHDVAETMVFEPAMKQGSPLAVWVQQTFNFNVH